MAQLTGNFEGTTGADIFAGSITPAEQTVEENAVTGAAIKQVIIDTFGGADTIEAITEVDNSGTADNPRALFLPRNGVGMTNADINTGSNADTVTISRVPILW